MRRLAALCLSLMMASFARPARAEELVLLLSTQDVSITSTYTGARVALFGLIERDARTIARSGRYEVAVTVTGPGAAISVRAKERTGPIWTNRTLRRFSAVPGYLAVLSSAPIETAANEEARLRQKMGLEYYLPAIQRASGEAAADDGAVDAVLRLRKSADLYVKDARGVLMPRPNIFNAHIPLPAAAPTGRYIVAVTLLSEGVPLAQANTSFVVRKVGFEAFVAQSARDNGLIYGLVAAFMAIVLGVLGNILFRKD